MSSKKLIGAKNISQIIERLKETFALRTDTEVAFLIGMTHTALYNHKIRRTIPYEPLSTFCDSKGMSFDWLLTGKGTMYITGADKPIPIEDIPKETIKEWIDEFWKSASEDERAWLKVQFPLTFPQFKEWLAKKQSAGTEGQDGSVGTKNSVA
ncbi:MAG: helix-turn-helix domain-containing protein [Nitrospirae bacterium]|nr:helix-turn-helix domain-containing protein [Nitrospirota bacterium]